MQNRTANSKSPSPPNLLRGILILSIGITSSILAIAWLIVDRQVEDLVLKRTSEYAHSIARIAADSSAEALLSEDKLQLSLLVENVAKDPYIMRATIYSEDGQIVTQHPEEITNLSTINDNNNPAQSITDIENEDLTQEETKANNKQQSFNQQFIRQNNNIPIIEQIIYQDITAGWFQIEVDRSLLERDLRSAYFEIQILTASIALLLFILLIFFIIKLEVHIKRLALHCQRLLIQNKITPPKKKSQWLEAIAELSKTHLQQLKEHVILPVATEGWHNSKINSHTLICYLEFEMQSFETQDIDVSQIAKILSTAESYLNQAIQSYGVQSQGDILSGCLIPFLNEKSLDPANRKKQLADAICFAELTRKLMTSLSQEIKIKTCFARAKVIYLEDKHNVITGMALVGKDQQKIRRAMLTIDFDEMISVSIPQEEFEQLVDSIVNLKLDDNQNTNTFKLNSVSSSIAQQISRKFSYIMND